MKGANPLKEDAPISLPELMTPWFLFLTAFRRRVRASQSHDPEAPERAGQSPGILDPETLDWVEGKLRGLLERGREIAAQNPHLAVPIQEARFPLIYFTIETLQNCGWPEDPEREARLFAPATFDIQIGGEDFYTRAHDPNLQNPEVIEIFYQCLCLGFKGMYADQPMRLREERDRLMRRLPLKKPQGPHFCSQAYEHTDPRDFVKLPMVATVRIAIAAMALICLIFWASAQYTSSTLEKVGEDLDKIRSLNEEHLKQKIMQPADDTNLKNSDR